MTSEVIAGLETSLNADISMVLPVVLGIFATITGIFLVIRLVRRVVGR